MWDGLFQGSVGETLRQKKKDRDGVKAKKDDKKEHKQKKKDKKACCMSSTRL